MAKRNIIIIYLVAVFVACTQYRANMRYCVRRGFHVFGKDNNGNLLPISLLPLGLRSGFGTRTSASLLHYLVRTTVFPLFLFIFFWGCSWVGRHYSCFFTLSDGKHKNRKQEKSLCVIARAWACLLRIPWPGTSQLSLSAPERVSGISNCPARVCLVAHILWGTLVPKLGYRTKNRWENTPTPSGGFRSRFFS